MPVDAKRHSNEDKAWASFITPFDKNALLEFCQDIERLLRINPYLVFEEWKKIRPQHYHLKATNHSQIPAFKIQTDLNVQTRSNGLKISYAQGIKNSTTLTIEPNPKGSKLIITERYQDLTEDERVTRLQEVDKSLSKWAEEIQAYLIHWQRWAWFTPWRFYMQHIWQPMKPSARRITYMLLWISGIEIALISLGTTIYFIEYR